MEEPSTARRPTIAAAGALTLYLLEFVCFPNVQQNKLAINYIVRHRKTNNIRSSELGLGFLCHNFGEIEIVRYKLKTLTLCVHFGRITIVSSPKAATNCDFFIFKNYEYII